MPSIGISLKRKYYTPEAFAYGKYLEENGWQVQLDYQESLSYENDITILFMGLDLSWKKNKFKKIIHYYPSLSTGRFPILKNSIKKHVNRIPDGRIYLNNFVKNGYDFKQCKNSLIIDVGIDKFFFENKQVGIDFDLVYSGVLLGREGLIEELKRLSMLGLRILIIGEVTKYIQKELKNYGEIFFSGRVDRSELPALYQSAKAGLSVSPDVYPFSSQTTIKTLEYLASGIGLVSSKYKWINEFSKKNNFEPLWVNSIKTKDDFDSYEFTEIDMSEFIWEKILDKVNFNSFMHSLLNKY